MENLKSVLISQVNIEDDTANEVVEVIRSYLKQRAPDFVSSVIDEIIEGRSVDEQMKGKTAQISDTFQNKAEMLTNDLKVAFEKLFGKTNNK